MLSDSESASDPYEGTNSDRDEDYLPPQEQPNLRFQLEGISSDEDPINLLDEDPINPDEVENRYQTASNTPQTGKKKLLRKALWRRNIQKNKRVKGEPYVNVAGILKPGQNIGNNCNCKLKCFDNIGHEGCTEIFRNFYAMISKDLQDAYLYGLIEKIEVQRKRPRSGDGHGKNASFVYKVRRSNFNKKKVVVK